MGLFNFAKTLAGPGYIILNVIRVLNIISLLLVIAASAVMLVKTFIVSKFFFFDAVTHVVEAWISIFLILTETPLFKTYFTNNWPLFSPTSGFLALGLAMMCLGNGVLGFLNKSSTSQQSLGMTFWRIVISAGILAFTMGAVNIFANFIFRDRANGITARQVRSYGAVASHKTAYSPSPSVLETGGGGGGLAIRRQNSLPSYYSSGATANTTTINNNSANGSSAGAAAAASSEMRQHQQASSSRLPFTISRPIAIQKSGESGNSQIVAGGSGSGNGIAEPDLAHHPALYGERI